MAEVPNPFPEEEKEQKVLGIDVGKVLDTILKLPLWQWILLLIALIILIGLLYYSERYRLKKKKERKLRKLEEQIAKEQQETEMKD